MPQRSYPQALLLVGGILAGGDVDMRHAVSKSGWRISGLLKARK
jgi:hypothetical protein